jgi:hypothetical protein
MTETETPTLSYLVISFGQTITLQFPRFQRVLSEFKISFEILIIVLPAFLVVINLYFVISEIVFLQFIV